MGMRFMVSFEEESRLSFILFPQDVAHGLRELLKYEGSVEEDMGLSFQVRHCQTLRVVGGSSNNLFLGESQTSRVLSFEDVGFLFFPKKIPTRVIIKSTKGEI